MANSKNTIQNIPLTGNLNLNTLKTDVSQFEGYNAKNSTVFGGALNPFWEKSSELFDKDTSFSFFNNKGNCYSLVKDEGQIKLYKDDLVVDGLIGNYVTKTVKMDVPNNTVVAVHCSDGKNLYLTKNGKLFLDGTLIVSLGFTNVFDAQIWVNNTKQYVIALDYTNYQFIALDSYTVTYNSGATSSGTTLLSSSTPLFTGGKEGTDDFTAYLLINSGKVAGSATAPVAKKFSWANGALSYTDSNTFAVEKLEEPFAFATETFDLTKVVTDNTLEVQQFCGRLVEKENDNYKMGSKYIGVSGGFIPCPIGKYTGLASIYYQDDGLISIGSIGEPVNAIYDYGRNMVATWSKNDIYSVTYQRHDGSWQCYMAVPVSSVTTDVQKYLEAMLFDKRYIFFKVKTGNDYELKVYDTETDQLVTNASNQDWIISEPPYSNSAPTENFGSFYVAGVNACYEINNAKFVGYLPNPFEVSYSPPLGTLVLPDNVPDNVQYFCSTGDEVMSAVYFGREPQYFGAIASDDATGNTILPLSVNAEIIPGYSNNDLVKEGTTVYPLMYFNNNQKTYTYYLSSAVENMTSVFSLQGQSYAVDDTSIYTIAFSNGVVSNVTPVCYKKNMIFIGTLPTQAIFWSKFNKTFYSFTGDRILSKMFEASDINSIHYVGQNPSSLSLWICTDTGIYIMSETDMYKLDFASHYVSFHDKFAYILVDGETNKIVHAITLYKNDDEDDLVKIPVKLQTKFYGLGGEKKAVMDCWYLRLWDKDKTPVTIKVKDTTITDTTKVTHEKPYKINKDDYDENGIVYIRHQPQFQECVAMQLELESPISIYQLSLGVNVNDSVAQTSKYNF